MIFRRTKKTGPTMRQAREEIAELKKRVARLEDENRDLRQANRLYRTIFEDVSVGIGVITPDGRLFTGNQRICGIWGYTEEEFFQKALADVIHPEELEGVIFMLNRIIDGEIDSYTREGRYIHKSGETMWLSASAAGVKNSDGRVTHIVAVFVDISDRKAMEEANKLDKERLRTIIRNSPDYILMLDTDGVVQYLSRPVGRYTPENIQGLSVLEIVPSESREEAKRCLQNAVSHLRPYRLTLSYPTRSGKIYYFGVKLAPVEADGKAVSLVVNASDITRQRKAEIRLQKSEERYRFISENIQDMICLHDTETRFTYVSPSLTKNLGYQAEDLLGQPTSYLIHPDDMATQMPHHVERVLGSGEDDTCITCRIRRKDGHYIWVETLSIPFVNQDGQVYQVLTSSRDITKRKLAEEALLQLAYGVSHNFNNILMAVMSNAQAVQGLCEKMPGNVPPRAIEYLNNVIRAASSGRDLVKRLSRQATGMQHDPGDRVVMDAASLLGEAASLARGTWEQFGRGTRRLSVTAEDGLKVMGVKGELSEVLLNLIKNAVEASPESGPIDLSAERSGKMVDILVKDRGTGLDPAIKDQIFNAFISSKGRQGMGLGLAMSRAVVESHGGEISADDRPGGGAVFTVRLPAHSGDEGAPQTSAGAAKPGGEKILLVEDESLVAAGIQAILERAGYQVVTAVDVQSALACLETEEPGVVLCDLGLPGGSGWDVMAKAVERDDPPGVIILTGWAGTEVAAVPEGLPKPDAVLSKPLNRQELVGEVGKALGRKC